MKKTVIYFIVISGITVGAMSCKKKVSSGMPANAPVPVNVIKATPQNVVFYDSYPATTVALKEVGLYGQVTGYVTRIFFNDGQIVKKGMKLYEIEPKDYLAGYEQAKDNVGIAQANLEKAQLDSARYTELNKQGAIAKQQFDNAMTNLRNAWLTLSSARNSLVKAQSDLNYSAISSPFDGTIGVSSVRMGALVVPGQTLLNIISSNDPMGVDFVINENSLERFRQLEKKSSTPNDSTFRLMLPDNSLYPEKGRIIMIDRAVDPLTSTIRVRLAIPNPDHFLKTGLTCNAQVLNENAGSQILIPFKAVVEQMGEYFVYVIKGKQANQVRITVGPQIGQNIIVTKGLDAGATIVTDGIQKLHNGSIIQIGMPNETGKKY